MSRAIFSLPLFNKHFLSLSRRISSFHRHSRRFLFKEDRTILLILELNSKIRNALSIDGGNYKCKPLAAITVAFRLGFGIITRSPRTTDQANDRGNRKKKKGEGGGREGRGDKHQMIAMRPDLCLPLPPLVGFTIENK